MPGSSERSLLFRIGADLSEAEKAIAKGAKSFDKIGKEFSNLGKSMSETVTLPIVGVGAAAVAASETVQGAMNTIRNGTGATGADLANLESVFKDVFTSVPQSAQQVATAIADLNTRTGLAGPALGAMAKQMLDLARISGTDVGPLVKSTTQAFNNWGVATEDQSRLLDFLWKVSQSTGISVQALADNLARSGATFRALGTPIEQAAVLLGQFDKNGIDTGAMLSGLNQAVGKLAQSGQPVAQAFNDILQKIREAPSASTAAAIAVQDFGESGARMADAVRGGKLSVGELTQSMRDSQETVAKAASETLTFSDHVGMLANQLNVALAPMGKAIVDAMLKMMPLIEQGILKVAGLVNQFTALPQSTQTSIIAIAGVAAAIGPALVAFGAFIQGASSIVSGILGVKGAIGAALPAISAMFSAAFSLIGSIVTGIVGFFPAIVSGAMTAGQALIGAGTAATGLATGPFVALVAALGLVALNWDKVKAAVVAAANGIASGASAAWDKTKSLTASAWDAITGIVSAGVSKAMNAASSLGGMLAAAGAALGEKFWDAVYAAFQKVSDYASQMWEGLKSGVQTAVSNAIGALNSFMSTAVGIINAIVSKAAAAASAINNTLSGGGESGAAQRRADAAPPSAPQGSPGSFGYGAEFSGGANKMGSPVAPASSSPAPAAGSLTVPALASGGIVDGATLALIGEAGPEAVVPLDRLKSMISGGGGGGITVNVFAAGSIASNRGVARKLKSEFAKDSARNRGWGIE